MRTKVGRWLGSAMLVGVVLVGVGMLSAGERSGGRTADMPDSWLVLYNLDDPDSVTWANWYQQERSIPPQNVLGLNASLGEHLPDLAAVQAEVICPARDYLNNNPAIEANIMGIILGYGLPGHYDSPPQSPSVGGMSVADALEEMFDDDLPPSQQQGPNDVDNPQFQGYMLPPGGRLTKTTMEAGRYMVARIDGPTLADAMALTQRAKAIEDPNHYLDGEFVWYDYTDPELGGSGEWWWLRHAVERPELSEVPWTEFDADTDQTPDDAFRFGTVDNTGWDDNRLFHPDAGTRILAFNLNSWGATTVRSTTADNARYVPNALAAGYAAAVGATGEPATLLSPIPETILAGLREGWTLGESVHISAVWDDWMWTLVGDPFLTIPHWFDEPAPPAPGDGDINGDGAVNGLDIQPFVGVFTGAITDPAQVAAADLDGNGQIDDDDAYLFFAPVLYGTYDWDVLKGTGDANGDGRVNGADIAPFVDMLLNGVAGRPLRQRWAADMNKDDQIAIDDLPLFIQALVGPVFLNAGEAN